MKPKACPSKENSLIWTKHGELYPAASGIQVSRIGQTDSKCINSKVIDEVDDYLFSQEVHKPRRQNMQKTRLLGDVVDALPQESTVNLQELVPQTCLYLPNVSEKRGKIQKKQKMKEMSKGLNFSDDAMVFHCSHWLDYDEKKLNKNVYHSPVVSTGQRLTKRTFPAPKVLNQNGLNESSLVQKPRALAEIDEQMRQELDDIMFSVTKASRPCRSNRPKSVQRTKSAQSGTGWDEYVLALLSKSTAKWLSDELTTGTQQARLINFLNNRYKECDVFSRSREQSKRQNSKAGTELEKVLTAANLEPHYSPSFTLPAAVGDKKFTSDNIFQQEMMAGAFPVRGRRAPRSKSIVLNTNSHLKFEKKLQANFPEDPKKWLHECSSKTVNLPGKVVKGLQRWNELPELLQDDAYVPSFQTFEKPTKTLREIELMSAHKARENNTVVRIGEEWRNKWLVEKRWQTASREELIRGMNDANDHVRLAAVAACHKAAEGRPHKKTDQQIFGSRSENETPDGGKMKKVSEAELLECITKLLDDPCQNVKLTAAVTLCTLHVSNPKALEVLNQCVQYGNDIERWLSAQCLALFGHCTDYIITELLSHTSNTDLVKQEQAAVLLWKLSQQTSLVHTVVSELLNSSSSHERLVACRLLPRLKGSMNKDVAQKLSHMMWNDWEKTVRTAAAQALGRTGNGKLVHDALLERLLDNNERIKADALRKLANLGVMTAHLLPAFLLCFNSEFVSVRIEASTASGAIKTPDDRIITALIKLANDDPSWKVKAHAINALGCIGKISEEVIEMLVWSMRYSKEAAVRAEACSAVAKLDLKDPRVLSVLQGRLVVETEDMVRSEAERALRSLGENITGDIEMLNTIQSEVKRLCKKENVVLSILQRDKQDKYNKDFERMIAADASAQLRSTETPRTDTSIKSSDSSKRTWDPILAGFRARSALSEPCSPVLMKMERSLLPMDLNSATSEGSQRTKSSLESEISDSTESTSSSVVSDIDDIDSENYPVNNSDQLDELKCDEKISS